MKKIISLFLLILTTVGFSQSKKKFKQFYSSIRNAKTQTTLFVVNQQYTLQQYEDILKEAWTVTPFKVIYNKDYNIVECAKNNYSVVSIGVLHEDYEIRENSTTTRITNSNFYYEYTYLNLSKIPKKNPAYNIYKKHIRNIGGFLLKGHNYFNPANFYKPLNKNNAYTLYDILYEPNLFINSDLLSLQSEFKKLNLMVENNTKSTYRKGKHLINKNKRRQLHTLVSDTLYIPYGTPKMSYKQYAYPYKVVPYRQIQEKVLSGEHVKYLITDSKEAPYSTLYFADIIDSKTGLPLLKLKSGSTLIANDSFLFGRRFYRKLFLKINKKVSKAKTFD